MRRKFHNLSTYSSTEGTDLFASPTRITIQYEAIAVGKFYKSAIAPLPTNVAGRLSTTGGYAKIPPPRLTP
ncbi:MAG: hypothetical protein ACYTXC_08940 [Nostoc sp.]